MKSGLEAWRQLHADCLDQALNDEHFNRNEGVA